MDRIDTTLNLLRHNWDNQGQIVQRVADAVTGSQSKSSCFQCMLLSRRPSHMMPTNQNETNHVITIIFNY